MNRLALGTVQFGMPYGIANRSGQVTRSEAKMMLQLAAQNGIDTLDTAIAYGDSEARLGEVGTQGFKLVTKLPAVPDDCVDVDVWVQQQVGASLARLGVTSVYALLLHRSEQYLGRQGTALHKALLRLKDNGQVQKLGVSIYMPAELDTLIPQYPIDLVQAPFNLVDQRLLTTGWLDRLKNEGIELHTRSSFLQGLLLMPRDAIPEQFSSWNQLWDRWNLWLQECRLPAAKVCLDFVRSFNQIDRIVIGADSLAQLEQLISFADKSPKLECPAMLCNDEKLINPANWSSLGKQK